MSNLTFFMCIYEEFWAGPRPSSDTQTLRAEINNEIIEGKSKSLEDFVTEEVGKFEKTTFLKWTSK